MTNPTDEGAEKKWLEELSTYWKDHDGLWNRTPHYEEIQAFVREKRKEAYQEGRSAMKAEVVEWAQNSKIPLRAKEDHLPNVYIHLKAKNELLDTLFSRLNEIE